MIKLELANEKPAVERTVHLEFRRHEQPIGQNEQTAFLVATTAQYNKLYPVKVDGMTKKFIVRRSAVEELGFELVISG